MKKKLLKIKQINFKNITIKSASPAQMMSHIDEITGKGLSFIQKRMSFRGEEQSNSFSEPRMINQSQSQPQLFSHIQDQNENQIQSQTNQEQTQNLNQTQESQNQIQIQSSTSSIGNDDQKVDLEQSNSKEDISSQEPSSSEISKQVK